MSVLPPFLESKALKDAGFRHAFSTRAAGDAASRDRLVAEQVGATRLWQATQVHGDEVLDAAEGLGLPDTNADALITNVPGEAVGIRVADCVPILLANDDGRVAAVHAGWRGVANGIIGKSIARLTKGDGPHQDGSRIIAAVGPHIGPCCFEVGHEVADQLGHAFVDRVVADKSFINLRQAVHAQLKASGVSVVDDVGECTKCHEATYHSFRRDADKSGRMLAAITAR